MTIGINGAFRRARGPRLGLLSAGLLTLGLAPAAVASQAVNRAQPASSPAFMVTHDCQEEQAFIDGSPAEVARALPSGYAPIRDPLTRAPVVFVRALQCAAITVDGQSTPATIASYGVTIKSPDGTGCASAAPVVGPVNGDSPPACNWYPLGWLATSQAIIDWFHAGLPGFPASYMPRLDFRIGAYDARRAGRPFHFDAPASTGAPFAMDASIRPRPGTLSVRGGYWHGYQATQDKLVFAGDLTSGDAVGVVSAPPGTAVARLLGATRRPYLPIFSAIAAEHWDTAVYRQQHVTPAPGTTTFSGSCSIHGTVTFAPPATNNWQTLNYAYSGRGSCTGILDGHHVAKTGVDWHQHGHAHGTCTSAKTTYPGTGHATFATGPYLAFTLDFTSKGTQVIFGLYGTRSGIANGEGSFLTKHTAPTVAADCANSGASTVPLNLTVRTETPMTSNT